MIRRGTPGLPPNWNTPSIPGLQTGTNSFRKVRRCKELNGTPHKQFRKTGIQLQLRQWNAESGYYLPVDFLGHHRRTVLFRDNAGYVQTGKPILNGILHNRISCLRSPANRPDRTFSSSEPQRGRSLRVIVYLDHVVPDGMVARGGTSALMRQPLPMRAHSPIVTSISVVTPMPMRAPLPTLTRPARITPGVRCA
jgi:hypothetical protein